jgi:hypothetical protein
MVNDSEWYYFFDARKLLSIMFFALPTVDFIDINPACISFFDNRSASVCPQNHLYALL